MEVRSSKLGFFLHAEKKLTMWNWQCMAGRTNGGNSLNRIASICVSVIRLPSWNFFGGLVSVSQLNVRPINDSRLSESVGIPALPIASQYDKPGKIHTHGAPLNTFDVIRQIFRKTYPLLTELELRTVSYGPSFLLVHLWPSARAINRSGKKRGSVTYSTDREDEVSKIFIISLLSVRRVRVRFPFMRNGFKFLKQVESKTSQLEIVFKSLGWFSTRFSVVEIFKLLLAI